MASPPGYLGYLRVPSPAAHGIKFGVHAQVSLCLVLLYSLFPSVCCSSIIGINFCPVPRCVASLREPPLELKGPWRFVATPEDTSTYIYKWHACPGSCNTDRCGVDWNGVEWHRSTCHASHVPDRQWHVISTFSMIHARPKWHAIIVCMTIHDIAHLPMLGAIRNDCWQDFQRNLSEA